MEQQPPRRLSLTVSAGQAGETVDTLLRRSLGLSGTVIRRVKWLEDGILLDGVRVHTNRRAAEGQVLSVRVADGSLRSGMVPVPGPLDIVYEDQDLLVVNKAPGVPCHPVHRLDRGTSGLLVVAKHPHAQEGLKGQLHTPQFRRWYLAVCQGAPEPAAGVIDAPIGPAPGSLMERRVDPAGQRARTHYRVLGTGSGRALVELELDTGRTHQIRVHMAHLGCPLTGDFLYGVEDPELIPRPALHSARLALRHPVTGEDMAWSLPLPEDMARLL